MDLVDRAKIRIEHWISHNEHHSEDYESFIKELDEAGKAESARYIREMLDLSSRSAECLKKALKALV
jgi:DNA-directed RNA polymerase alpha subunit